jgi:hypothetical protein
VKNILILPVIFLLLGVLGFFGFQYFQNQQKVKAITSYEECAKLFPVMDSYPPRCVTSDHRSFTQDIGNELQYHDEILVANPRPHQVLKSPLQITGKARGLWFFEASFTAELYDSNNEMIGTAIMLAQGEWMTGDFVPFSGDLPFSKPITKSGTLKIKNANPSGMKERDKILTMPVKFE